MSIRTLWAWLRMVITLIVLFAIVLAIWMNWDKKADVWLFYDFKQIPVLWLIVITAVVSIVAKWVVGDVYRAYRELKSAQTRDKMDELLKKEKASQDTHKV